MTDTRTLHLRYRRRHGDGAARVGALAQALVEQGLWVGHETVEERGFGNDDVTMTLWVGANVSPDALFDAIKAAWAKYKNCFPHQGDSLDVDGDEDPDDGWILGEPPDD